MGEFGLVATGRRDGLVVRSHFQADWQPWNWEPWQQKALLVAGRFEALGAGHV